MRQTFSRSHLVLVAAIIGLTWSGGSNAGGGPRSLIAKETAVVKSTIIVPSEQRFDLRSYGNRFKLAIEAIENESRKPAWIWDDCDDDGRIEKMMGC